MTELRSIQRHRKFNERALECAFRLLQERFNSLEQSLGNRKEYGLIDLRHGSGLEDELADMVREDRFHDRPQSRLNLKPPAAVSTSSVESRNGYVPPYIASAPGLPAPRVVSSEDYRSRPFNGKRSFGSPFLVVVETAIAAIELAEIGFSIAETFHEYAKGVNSSQKQIRNIGHEVDNTSKVLKQANLQLDIGQQSRLYSEEGRATAHSALDGCRQVFDNLKLFLDGVVKYRPDGRVSVKTIEKWPLKSSELEQSRRDLERCKSTLQLSLMVVLLKQSTTNSDATIAGMLRLQIADLVKRAQIKDDEQVDKEPPAGVDHAGSANKHEPFPKVEHNLTTTGVQLLAMPMMRDREGSRQTSPSCFAGAEGLNAPNILTTRSMHEISKEEIHASKSDPFAGIGWPPKPSLSKFEQAIISDIVRALDLYSQSAAELASAIMEANGQWRTRKELELYNADALLRLVCLRSVSLRSCYKRYSPAEKKKPKRMSDDSTTASDNDRPNPQLSRGEPRRARELLGIVYPIEERKVLPPLVTKTEKANIRFRAEDSSDELVSRFQPKSSAEDLWTSDPRPVIPSVKADESSPRLHETTSPPQKSKEPRSPPAATENKSWSWLSHEVPIQKPELPPPKDKNDPRHLYTSNVASGCARVQYGITSSMGGYSAVPTEQQATGEGVAFEQDPVDELLQRWTV
ncbi:hypothetical protein HII31_09498 [Pseudocercospora fuligena]|uniref:Fungal N-terminal domain-containing protein n=1 Tax=Pseudocercospora fuligena TaxID=685502 RepID=A0A8H6RAM6_9PEZI|nr:hypothetical protein HII31_09498 [Pseudocercospora fuligena]